MAEAVEDLKPLFALEQGALQCPYALLNRVREEAPITFVPEVECFVVSRYDDIVYINRHPELFSSARPTGPIIARQQMAAIQELMVNDEGLRDRLLPRAHYPRVLISADPPDHARQRKLVNRAFTPPKVKLLEPRIRTIANELIDAFADRGEVELVGEFATPLPLIVIAECLGVDKDLMPTFKRWSDDTVALIGNHNVSPDVMRRLVVSQLEFDEYFTGKIEERRADPQNDLITDVVQARLDGEPLTVPEMLSMFIQFLVAGNETTTKLIASSVRMLCEQPGLMATLRDRPELIGGFIEEALRVEPPVLALYRTATGDTEVNGVAIPARAHLMLMYAAGNRDERVFDEADSVDPCRGNAMRHLAFGHGEHYCLGSALARAEGRIGVEALLGRFGELSLAGTNTFEYEPSYVLHGLKELHLRVRAG